MSKRHYKTSNVEGLPCGSLGDPSFCVFLALGRICVRIVFLSILRALLGGLSGSPGVLFIEITLYKSDLWKTKRIYVSKRVFIIYEIVTKHSFHMYQACMNIYETFIYHLSNCHSTFIEHLSNMYEHLCNMYLSLLRL